MRLSIIVPILNEGELAVESVKRLASFRAAGHELIVVDGGSENLPTDTLKPHVDHLLTSLPGRATQMNLGASVATGDVLWFLHVDSLVDPSVDRAIFDAVSNGAGWGRFDIRLSGSQSLLRLVERMMNWRSCRSGIATGDQGIFIHRSLFARVEGYPEQALMEDIEISRRLKRHMPPVCLREKLLTSSRRWEQQGILRTIVLMWGLRLAYWLGVSPARLAGFYRPCKTTPS
ncbi:MAG: TIGR04283 family arsenosugar biosynthesis glycosyltransferase [Candidatus Thiodiazotropha sp. (ex Myrtea spinifera)]|nr:TIGR04283 family arsenosugar biosynthesis glycosyltransferase [Candidatus Thiodiazotropha sp. (ex Myrtea spinifera)]